MDDPHLLLQLKKMGAQIVFHAVNGLRDRSERSQVVIRAYHESNLQLRAQSAQLYVVTVDNAEPASAPNSCAGGVLDPKGRWAMRLCTTGEQYGIYDIDLA